MSVHSAASSVDYGSAIFFSSQSSKASMSGHSNWQSVQAALDAQALSAVSFSSREGKMRSGYHDASYHESNTPPVEIINLDLNLQALESEDSSEDVCTPSLFDDFAFLEETGGILAPPVTAKPKPVAKPKPQPVVKPQPKKEVKVNRTTKPSPGFLKKSVKRSNSFFKPLKSVTTTTTTTTTTFVEYPFYQSKSSGDYDQSTTTASLCGVEELDYEEPLATSPPSSDSEGGGYFNDMSFLEAQEILSQPRKGHKSKESSKSGSSFTRFRSRGSEVESMSSGAASLRLTQSTATTPAHGTMRSVSSHAPSYASMPSQIPSHTSISNLPSPPPSLTGRSSSPSVASTLLPSPSASSRQASMQFAKVLPALPVDFSEERTFGRDYSTPPLSARYIFDPPSPLKEEAESPRRGSPARPNRPPSGPMPPPKHSRQRSSNYQVEEVVTPHPPRGSSLGAVAFPGSSPVPSPPVEPPRLNRASLSAVLAREERERTISGSSRMSSSPVSPTPEDIALLPGLPAPSTYNRLGLSSAYASLVVPRPRNNTRMSVLSADGGPTSPCNSIIAAFPSPPELQAEERAEYEQALALALQPSYFAPTHPGLTRVRDQRPQSDAFSFDDDYWLNHEEDTPRAEVPATRPLRVVTDGKPAKSSNSPLSGPPTQAPSLQLPELLSNPYGKCASLDSIIHDINQLIEHARPESVTIPDFASLHREGHANYDQEILASPSSRPASHIFPLDQREKRSETPTSRAARNEALLALESLASAAGYRLVRQSYVSQREDL